MVVLGAVVLIVAIVVTVAVIANGGQGVNIGLHWGTLHTNAAAVFVIGAFCLAAAVIGIWLLLVGLRGGYRRRREMKTLRARAEARTPDKAAGGSQRDSSRASSGTADDHFDSAPKEDDTR